MKSINTRLRTLLFSTLIAAACAMGSNPSWSETATTTKPQTEKPKVKPEITPFDSWSLVCTTDAATKKKNCAVQQNVAEAKSKKVFFTWSLVYARDGKLVSIVRTPTGLLLTKGLEMHLAADKATRVPFRVCGQRGCEARFAMDKDLIATVSKKDNVAVKFFNANDKPVQFNVPMKGFSRAIAALEKSASQGVSAPKPEPKAGTKPAAGR